MIKNLSNRGYSIYKNDLNPIELDNIKKELTVKAYVPEGYGLPANPFKLYLEGPNKIYVPKSYGLQKCGLANMKYENAEHINVEFTGTLRKEQLEPVKAFMDSINNPLKMGGILNLPCGFGKTTIAINLICQLKVKTLIVVHKDFLLQQWKERIEQFAPSAKIGYIKAQIIDIIDKDIVIGSLQSLSMKEYDVSVFSSFSFVIIDEVHHIGAEVFSQALRKITFKYSLGLSATINRKDGLTKVFKWFLGDILFSIKKRTDSVQVQLKYFKDTSPEYCEEVVMYNYKPNMSKMINNICAYKPRIVFIRDIIINLIAIEDKRKILVLSDRRNHLENMKKEFEEHKISAGLYYGGLKQEVLKETETKQVILATYNMVSEGFDLPSLNTLILASPKSDIVQSSGRILREKEECRIYQPLIIDIIDSFSLFGNQSKKRQDFYKKNKYDIDGKQNKKDLELPKGQYLMKEDIEEIKDN